MGGNSMATRPRRRCSRWLWYGGWFAAAVMLCALLAGCPLPVPTPVPPASIPPVLPTATPTRPLTAGLRVQQALLSPAELTFAGRLPASGWRRCDERVLEVSLKRFRRNFDVLGSAASTWTYGTSCSSADQVARLDEYGWILADTTMAARARELALAMSPLAGKSQAITEEVRTIGNGTYLLRTLAREPSAGRREQVAEVIAREGTAVIYLYFVADPGRMPAAGLTPDIYFALAQLCLDRLAAPL